MTRLHWSVASVVLAFTSVAHGVNVTRIDAKADAQIHLYPFSTGMCLGQPIGSPIELKQGQCVPLSGAYGVKPVFRSDHQDWINEVNELQTHCKLEVFRSNGCHGSEKIDHYTHHRSGSLPKNFGRCLSGHQKDDSSSDSESSHVDTINSVRFVCGKLEDPELLCTSTIKHTSWSMDPSGNPSHSERTATYTGTLSATASEHVARSIGIDVMKPTHVPRGGPKPDSDTRGVWMRHPWSDSMMCYLCYTKKRGDYGKIECRAGTNFAAQCNEQHFDEDGQPTTPHATTTITATAVSTTHTTTTKVSIRSSSRASNPMAADLSSSGTDSDSDFPHLDAELSQKKSWHRPVKFEHPFVSNTHLCADAEWEKRGRPESYIKIQHCHVCDHKDRADSKWIGLPETMSHTVSETTTTTNTIKHTQTRRHDQL